MVLVRAEGGHASVAAEAREVFDVSGAGDTVIATLALAHASGRPLEEAMRIANAAAGIVVGKLGTATVGADELEHALHIAGGGDGGPEGPRRSASTRPCGGSRSGARMACAWASPMAVSTSCTPGTFPCCMRRGGAATGWWSASTRTNPSRG